MMNEINLESCLTSLSPSPPISSLFCREGMIESPTPALSVIFLLPSLLARRNHSLVSLSLCSVAPSTTLSWGVEYEISKKKHNDECNHQSCECECECRGNSPTRPQQSSGHEPFRQCQHSFNYNTNNVKDQQFQQYEYSYERCQESKRR